MKVELNFAESHNLLRAADCEKEKEWIDYLEKQKEQKPTISDEAIREGIVHFGITQYQIDNWLKKHINIIEQKEQKPEQYSPLCNTIKDKINEYIANHFIADTVVKTDIKSIVKAMEEGVRLGKESRTPAEWSEEDEKILHAIEWHVGQLDIGETINGFSGSDMLRVLKSIRSQPKQEWSEEDDWKRKELIQYLEEKGDYRTVWMTWLKSLRLCPSWKPSEEQEEPEYYQHFDQDC